MTTPVFGEQILAGKGAFVVGGTRGFNLSIAQRYAAQGAKVVVASRDVERTAAAAESIRAAGGEALGIPLDVRNAEALSDAFKRAADTFGGLDIIVAGQAGNFFAPAGVMSPNGFRAVIEVDLVGTFSVFRLAYDHVRRDGASMIAISAPQGEHPLPMQAHACAAKAGINMLIKCLAVEWGPEGTRVNGISPGPIENTFGMHTIATRGGNEAMIEHIRQSVPLKRWGRHDDITEAALFLASPAASYITGTILDVDGGVSIADRRGADADDAATKAAGA